MNLGINVSLPILIKFYIYELFFESVNIYLNPIWKADFSNNAAIVPSSHYLFLCATGASVASIMLAFDHMEQNALHCYGM